RVLLTCVTRLPSGRASRPISRRHVGSLSMRWEYSGTIRSLIGSWLLQLALREGSVFPAVVTDFADTNLKTRSVDPNSESSRTHQRCADPKRTGRPIKVHTDPACHRRAARTIWLGCGGPALAQARKARRPPFLQGACFALFACPTPPAEGALAA